MSNPSAQDTDWIKRHPVAIYYDLAVVAIWHGIFDLLTASKAGQDMIPLVMSALVIVWALFIANVEKRWGFRFQEKHTL